MIEKNIIEWLEIGDSIQRLDVYNKESMFIFQINYLFSQYSHFSEYFYLFLYFIFFAQIWEINLLKVNVDGDSILKIIKYYGIIFIITEYITPIMYTIYIFIATFVFSSVLFISFVNIYLVNKNRKNGFLLSLNVLIYFLNIYFINGPSLQIMFYSTQCKNGNEYIICPIKGIRKMIERVLIYLYMIFIIGCLFTSTFYVNDIGCINGSNVRCKINNNYTTIIIMMKAVFFIFYIILNFFIKNENHFTIICYHGFLVISNICISIYSYKELFYYNYKINALFHYGWYYSSWFSICIFLKKIIGIKDITLFIILGIILITLGFYFNNKYREFQLITEFNMFEENNLIDIEVYNYLLLNLIRNKDKKSQVLISGVIRRFEEYINNNSEIYEIYHKLINDKHLKNKFSSTIELTILSIISIVYTYIIEKLKDKTDIVLTMCYFLVNNFKNPIYAIWLCSKIKTCTHLQSYYKFSILEEIKDYLINLLNKNQNKDSLNHIEITSVILYNQYIDLLKMKIYDATCSQFEYFDILKNNIITQKNSENFISIGENIISLRKDILNLWDKIILLNPFSNESEKDYMIYLKLILQDEILMRNEEKRYKKIKNEKLSERNNPYYSLFNQESSSVLLADGNSFNGKIFYATPNFPLLFKFTGKEILNTSIEDLIPDIIQNFHKYLIEDAIKYSNLNYIYKKQKDSFIKGKNGEIFNIYLYVRPVPNLSLGLNYIIYLQKFYEQHFIIFLDENYIIKGFTLLNHIDLHFTLNNKNYGLSNNINGHHIGLIIPDILLRINYDIKTNSFFIPENLNELKGTLYPINNFKELDYKITEILEIIKEKKIDELNNKQTLNSFVEYNEFIKLLNEQCSKLYSIFYRIELHNFIEGKYKYYRLYISSDLFAVNENSLSIETSSNLISNKDNYLNFSKSKEKMKSLNENNSLKNNQNVDYKNSKFLRLKNEFRIEKRKITNKNKELNQINNKEANIIDNYKKTSFNDKNKNLSFNNSSNMSSLFTQSSSQSSEFNKLKHEIINKSDFFIVRLMRYLYFIFVFINILLIIYNYYKSHNKIDSMIEFLKE